MARVYTMSMAVGTRTEVGERAARPAEVVDVDLCICGHAGRQGQLVLDVGPLGVEVPVGDEAVLVLDAEYRGVVEDAVAAVHVVVAQVLQEHDLASDGRQRRVVVVLRVVGPDDVAAGVQQPSSKVRHSRPGTWPL